MQVKCIRCNTENNNLIKIADHEYYCEPCYYSLYNTLNHLRTKWDFIPNNINSYGFDKYFKEELGVMENEEKNI